MLLLQLTLFRVRIFLRSFAKKPPAACFGLIASHIENFMLLIVGRLKWCSLLFCNFCGGIPSDQDSFLEKLTHVLQSLLTVVKKSVRHELPWHCGADSNVEAQIAGRVSTTSCDATVPAQVSEDPLSDSLSVGVTSHSNHLKVQPVTNGDEIWCVRGWLPPRLHGGSGRR